MDSFNKVFSDPDMRDDCGTSPTICKAYKQYCYTPGRQEYLDMVTYTAHVGHNHPLIVSAGQSQLRQLLAGQGFYSQPLLDLVKTLHSILPSSLKHQYVINSGSEANDLALRLARNYTNGDDFIVFEGAYHGSLSNLLDLSTPALELLQLQKPPETHIVHPPDLYGGPFRDDDPDACNKYVAEVEAAITDIKERGGKLAAFICEPISVACGALVPPRLYFKKVFELVHQAGGVVIADETGCGMGRAGEHYWTFQHFDIVPDIVTVGKSIGNGFPLGIAITTKEVADSLGEHYSTFGGNPVASCIAKSVLEVIHGEMMLTSARSVGKFLVSELRSVQERVQSVGEVRGRGLCLGIVIVRDKETRQPHPQLARNIVARLERKGFLVSRGGLHKNVLVLTPPLCVTQLDARQFTAAFEDALTEALSHPGVPGNSVSTPQGPDATPAPARTESHEAETSYGNPLLMNKERQLIDEVIKCPGNQVVLADDREELGNKRRKTE